MLRLNEKKLSAAQLIYFQILYNLFIKLLITAFGVPSAAIYISDIITIVLLFMAFNKIYSAFRLAKARVFLWIVAILFISTLIGWCVNVESIFLYLWGVRNLGRFLAFFLACVVFLKKKDVYKIISLFYKCFIINFFVCLWQYWVMGISGDYLGGIFGIAQGGNAFMNIHLCLIIAYSVCSYLEKQITTKKIVLISTMALFMATLAELKLFYFEFAFIVILATLLQRKMSFRKVVIIVVSSLVLVLAYHGLNIIFPDSMQYLTLEGATDYLSGSGHGYSSVNDLNRFTAFSSIQKMFFKQDIIKNLFGLGLGSCENSTVSIFNSVFYNQYEYLHYRWFFHAMTYLELGIVGVVCYLAFFVCIYIYAGIILKNTNNNVIKSFSQIIVAIVIVSCIYNSSLRIESAYFSFFLLSIPIIWLKDQKAYEDMPLKLTHIKLKINI